jgi:hypothetical protein
MDVVAFEDPIAFRERAADLLLADEARHNLMLGILWTLTERPGVYEEARLWTVEDQGRPVVAAIHTPPWNLVVSRPSQDGAIEALAEGLHQQRIELPGVTGADPEGDAFAGAWSARTGTTARLSMAQRIYRLTTVRPVRFVSGSMRDATEQDRNLLVEWVTAFTAEVFHEGVPGDPARMVDLGLRGDGAGLVLWEDGPPVSMAGFGGRTPNGARVGPVYTPPSLRRRGYATAVVAALSQSLLDEGRRFCFLYTDLANPTSNRIYIDIGYGPVCDSRDYRFEPALRPGSPAGRW